MNRILIKQVVVLPLAAIVLPIVWAVFVPGYSSVSQHGLYGLAMFYVLVPACFAAELPRTSQRSIRISLVAAFVFLAYLWLQFSGLDPHGFRGLTQRLFVLALTGWFSYAGLVLLRGQEPQALSDVPDHPFERTAESSS